MHIWIDADACPNPVKEIIYRLSARKSIHTTFIANQRLTLPASPFIHLMVVSAGFDEADNEIVKQVNENDLVITADIPLAHDAINKKVHVITPRGERLTLDTIKEKLVLRDFMDTMRASGVQSKGCAPYSNKDKERFANELDKLINQIIK